MRNVLYIALSLIFLTTFPALADSEKLFNAQSYTLDNGLEVITIRNNRAPVVTQMVWYKTGAADEPNGQSGIAHYMEHLMFKGSPNVAPGEFSKTIRELGGNDNAFTSQDYTAYFQTLSSRFLSTAMEMEADRMRDLKVPESQAQSELLVVLEERRQRLENDPHALFFADLKAALYPDHPYGTPIIGRKSDVEKLTLKQAEEYHKTHYAPNNARLIIAGDLKEQELKQLVEKHYGNIKSRKTPPRYINRDIEPLTANKTITTKHSRILQSLYARLYQAPNWQNNKQESLALTVLQELLDGGPSGPLYQDIVAEKKYATSVKISYSGQSLGPDEITITATAAQGVDLQTLKTAIDSFLERHAQKEWTQAEIKQAVTRIQDSTIYLRDSITGPAMIIGQALATGMSLADVEHYSTLLDSVTVKDVTAVFNKYMLPTTHYVEGYLEPKSTVSEVKQ